MRTRTTTLACAAGLCLLASPALAQEDFTLSLDQLVIENLYTDVDTNSSKFEEYRDLDSGLRIPRLAVSGQGGDRYLDIRLLNADREDGRYTMRYGVWSDYDIVVDYNKIPHRFGNDARLLWTETGPGRFEIADPTQRSLQESVAAQFGISPSLVNFDFLDGLLTPHIQTASELDLGLRRDRAFAKVELGKAGRFNWGFDWSHENRVGNRPYGAAFGFNNVNELPEPVDYDTTGATLRGQWVGEQGSLSMGYRFSEFENNTSTLIWDNPFRSLDSTSGSAYQSPSGSSIDGSSIGQIDLAPSNESDDVFLSGRLQFAGDWWLTGGASWITMTQDDPLLPYTVNSAIDGIGFDGSLFDATDPGALPARAADTEVDVFSLNTDVGTRFGEDFTFILRYRYYDYDNSSRRLELPGYARYDAVWEEIQRVTVPHSYTRDSLGAELGWEIGETSNLNLAYTLESWDREFREVDSADEDIIRLSFDTQPSRRLSLRAAYELGDRSIDDYRVEAQLASFLDPEEEVNNLPDLRKYDEAAREYDLWDVQVQLFPSDVWSVFLGIGGRDEDYDESAFGLLADELTEFNAEVSYTPGARSSFYAFYSLADRDVEQAARQSGSTPSENELDNWLLALDESNDTLGLGWTGTWSERWETEVSALYTESDGEADFTAFAGGAPLSGRDVPEAQDFDNYEDIELTGVRFAVDYTVNDNVGVGFWYRYEEYTIDSFILQALDFYLPGALLLNGSQGDYEANLVALNLKLTL